MKVRKSLIMFTIASAVLIGSCKKDNFKEDVGICPIVVSTSPETNATDVLVTKIITVTFNEKMDPSTINKDNFIVTGTNSIGGVVTYDDQTKTMSFNPTNNLAENTTYTCRVLTFVKDLDGNALQTDYVWAFSTGTILVPIVLATIPINNASAVPVDQLIQASFSMRMDNLSFTDSTFKVQLNGVSINGVLSFIDSTVIFNPNVNLMANSTYTCTIKAAVKNTLGTNLNGDYVWSFITAPNIPPTVISTDPINNANGVPLNKIIAANFSIKMDPSTMNASTYSLKIGANTVAGSVSYTDSTVTFTPASPLLSNTVYTATVTSGAKNLAGTSLANNYSWNFTTIASIPPTVILTDPIDLASSVALNKVITADFSTNMDPTTINSNTFTLKIGNTPVSGVVSYSGVKASFNPNSNLLSGTTYTATITTGAKNLAGTPIVNNYEWTFTTVAPLGPPIVDLKTVARFGIIAGVGVSNAAGFSEIRNMDVGISPGVRSSITGFPPAIVVNGAIYASDDIAPPGVPAMLTQAKQDLTDAYLFAEGATTPAPATVSGDLGGQTLAPGIYKSNTTLLVQSGDLTLDAQGDVNAVWIFQVASSFTTVGGAGGNIILSGGAQAKNVFWQVGSSATIGDNTSFKGNVLALTSITMNSGAVAEGRMLARNGAVVMTNANIINKP